MLEMIFTVKRINLLAIIAVMMQITVRSTYLVELTAMEARPYDYNTSVCVADSHGQTIQLRGFCGFGGSNQALDEAMEWIDDAFVRRMYPLRYAVTQSGVLHLAVEEGGLVAVPPTQIKAVCRENRKEG